MTLTAALGSWGSSQSAVGQRVTEKRAEYKSLLRIKAVGKIELR